MPDFLVLILVCMPLLDCVRIVLLLKAVASSVMELQSQLIQVFATVQEEGHLVPLLVFPTLRTTVLRVAVWVTRGRPGSFRRSGSLRWGSPHTGSG